LLKGFLEGDSHALTEVPGMLPDTIYIRAQPPPDLRLTSTLIIYFDFGAVISREGQGRGQGFFSQPAVKISRSG
jgi:hypothetical protein